MSNDQENPNRKIPKNEVLENTYYSDAFSPEIDCALAGQNMMLAAKSLGIGSCWIGLA